MAPHRKTTGSVGIDVPSKHGARAKKRPSSAKFCCEDMSLVKCANTSTPPLGAKAPLPYQKQHTRMKPVILVMQLATTNLWDSFCKHSIAVNSAWARLRGHRYLVTSGEYLNRTDLWRGGNVRAVLEVMTNAPKEVDWLFHLDCDASFVDFSGEDALQSAIEEFANDRTEVVLSRDESGFAGASRLTNMGTGLWRKSVWTSKLLQAWWTGIQSDPTSNEQENLERLLRKNTLDCLDHIAFLPAGRLNSESANPIASPPRRQPVIHLAGMPDVVRTVVFENIHFELCQAKFPNPDGWTLRELLLRELQKYVESLPDEPDKSSDDWTALSAPARNARRLALALLRGGRDREGATRFFGLAFKRAVALESALASHPRFAHAVAGFLESLAGPLLELGRTKEAQGLMLRPWPKHAATPRHAMDELIRAENLCSIFQAEGRLHEAEKLARKALRGMEAAFPASARDVRPAGARARLAHILHSRGLAKEAEPLLRTALSGYEASLGFDHPETLGCARNLAVLLKQMPESRQVHVLPEAESLLRRAVAGYSKQLGSEHPETVRAQRNLNNFRRWLAKKQKEKQLEL